jgi:membrane associated rhomboid family serine protease
MLLMPYLSRIIPPFLPVGVVLLVLVNLLVFFGAQQGDEARFRRAVDYYSGSVLAEVEPERYRAHLLGRGEHEAVARLDRLLKNQRDLAPLLRQMADDREFSSMLRQGALVSPEDEIYGRWRQARQSFDGLMAGVVGERYALRNERPSLLTALSSQFLHADPAHLMGNMLVLALIGPAVEGLVGTAAFLVIYLLGGMAGAGLWLLASNGSGLIGASGAIAAVMGAFSVLLRWRRIPFFYFAVVYFDIIRAPALLALPIWLLNEAVQLLWLGGGRVAYEAHIGGLLTGALCALPLLSRAQGRLLPEVGEAQHAAPVTTERRDRYLAQARKAMLDTDFDRARRAYARAAAHTGNDPAVWQECLNVLKLAPASEEFHQASLAFLRRAPRNRDTLAMLPAFFMEYLRLSQPRPRLDAERLAALGEAFLDLGRGLELERAARLLHALAPADPRSRRLLLAAAGVRRQAGDELAAVALNRLAGSADPN